MARVMLLGNVGCGKTTLIQKLRGADIVYAKTETTQRGEDYIDTPGEYLAYGFMRRALQQSSYDAKLIGFLQSAVEPRATIQPGFHTYFTQPVIGIVTKIDLATPDQIGRARRWLELAGARTIVEVSALTGAGLDELRELLAGH